MTRMTRGRLVGVAVAVGGVVGLLLAAWVRVAAAETRADQAQRAADSLRLDPLGLAAHPPVTAPAGGVVLLGDSRFSQWPASALPAGVVNRGIGGQTTAQLVARAPVDVVPLRPRVVIVQAGVNDVVAGLTTGDRDAERRAVAHLRALADTLTAHGARVVLTTVLPPARGAAFDGIAAGVARVNAELRTLARPGVVVVDLAAALAPDGRLAPDYAADPLHLTPAGYARVAALVLEP